MDTRRSFVSKLLSALGVTAVLSKVTGKTKTTNFGLPANPACLPTGSVVKVPPELISWRRDDQVAEYPKQPPSEPNNSQVNGFGFR